MPRMTLEMKGAMDYPLPLSNALAETLIPIMTRTLGAVTMMNTGVITTPTTAVHHPEEVHPLHMPLPVDVCHMTPSSITLPLPLPLAPMTSHPLIMHLPLGTLQLHGRLDSRLVAPLVEVGLEGARVDDHRSTSTAL